MDLRMPGSTMRTPSALSQDRACLFATRIIVDLWKNEVLWSPRASQLSLVFCFQKASSCKDTKDVSACNSLLRFLGNLHGYFSRATSTPLSLFNSLLLRYKIFPNWFLFHCWAATTKEERPWRKEQSKIQELLTTSLKAFYQKSVFKKKFQFWMFLKIFLDLGWDYNFSRVGAAEYPYSAPTSHVRDRNRSNWPTRQKTTLNFFFKKIDILN